MIPRVGIPAKIEKITETAFQIGFVESVAGAPKNLTTGLKSGREGGKVNIYYLII